MRGELTSMDVIPPGSGWILLTVPQYRATASGRSWWSIPADAGGRWSEYRHQMGYVCAATTVSVEDELLVTTKEGVMIRIPAGEIRVQGRSTQGVRIMNVKPGDEMAAVARMTWGAAEGMNSGPDWRREWDRNPHMQSS